MMRCILIDDEAPALRLLENFAGKVPDLEIVGKFSNAEAAQTFVIQNSPDIIFLDIQMPKLNGIELLKTLSTRPVSVFTTANHNFAMDAYNLDVVDYLVKPFSFERFLQAAEKAIALAKGKTGVKNSNTNAPAYITVKADYKLLRINLDDIKYIEGWSEYVKIHTKERVVITLESLRNLELALPAAAFLRIHKSFIVNTNLIQSFNTQEISLTDSNNLPIGKVYKDEVMQRLAGKNKA